MGTVQDRNCSTVSWFECGSHEVNQQLNVGMLSLFCSRLTLSNRFVDFDMRLWFV